MHVEKVHRSVAPSPQGKLGFGQGLEELVPDDQLTLHGSRGDRPVSAPTGGGAPPAPYPRRATISSPLHARSISFERCFFAAWMVTLAMTASPILINDLGLSEQ
jgi:hypothetical protein